MCWRPYLKTSSHPTWQLTHCFEHRSAPRGAALTGAAVYSNGFLAKLVLQDVPSGAEYGGAITRVAAVLIVQSGVKAVKLSGDHEAMF
jgi:hypothetical protein